MSTFVLVHGAWHGGWCWRWVRKLLEQKGHSVYTPTMTGLGERAHLMSEHITMATVVEDVANVIKYEDLDNVVLVGHSFGGAVISGVAECFPDRIKQLIYLDAAVLENGECMFDLMPEALVSDRKLLAKKSSNGMSLPVPTAEDLGVFSGIHRDLLSSFLTPQPLSTYQTSIKLRRTPGAGFNCNYIVCTNPMYIPLDWARGRADKYGWPIFHINAGHEAMITAPAALSEMLMQSVKSL